MHPSSRCHIWPPTYRVCSEKICWPHCSTFYIILGRFKLLFRSPVPTFLLLGRSPVPWGAEVILIQCNIICYKHANRLLSYLITGMSENTDFISSFFICAHPGWSALTTKSAPWMEACVPHKKSRLEGGILILHRWGQQPEVGVGLRIPSTIADSRMGYRNCRNQYEKRIRFSLEKGWQPGHEWEQESLNTICELVRGTHLYPGGDQQPSYTGAKKKRVLVSSRIPT